MRSLERSCPASARCRSTSCPSLPRSISSAPEGAYQAAVTMLSGPLELYYEDKQWTIQPAIIGKWIDFRRADGC